MQAPGYSSVLRDRNLAVILLLGFSSGLPLALTGQTLQAWMTVEGVDLATIGLLTLVGIPYTWKFLWAPLLDRFVPLALALLAPIIVGILTYHIYMAPSSIGPGIAVLVMELFLAWAYRNAFRPMLVMRVMPAAGEKSSGQ